MLKFLKRNKKGGAYEVRLPDQYKEGKIETASSTWTFMSKWVDEQLLIARERNDAVHLDEIKTAALRGRIKLLKEVLRLPEHDPKRSNHSSKRD